MSGDDRTFAERALNAILGRYPKLAYIHVPKCAGTAAVDSLFRAVYPSFLRATRAYRFINLRASRAAGDLLELPSIKIRQAILTDCLSDPIARFVTGHVHANPKLVREFQDWKFVTVLRNPIDRYISQYVYDRHKQSDWAKLDSSFPQFLESTRGRRSGFILARYFSGLTAAEIEQDPESAISASIANLGNFFSVGFVEDLDSWAEQLHERLGRKPRLAPRNASPKPALYQEIHSSRDLMEQLQSASAIDLRIFDEARARFGR